MRGRAACIVLSCISVTEPLLAAPQTATGSQRSGAELYRAACIACHGPDGKGAPRAVVGFDAPLPDFTDCSFATPEADADWIAVVHHGGRARAFDAMMPAFGAALEPAEIVRVVAHLRSFCAEPGWPRGDLNLPRPLTTEKAFPENEAVVTTTVSRRDPKSIGSELIYERRLGRRGQWELSVPLASRQSATGRWLAGAGDIALGYKHVAVESLRRGSILSVGTELILPTGSERKGLGGGAAVVEPFAALGQILPRDAFLHLHAGLEVPVGSSDVDREIFWRGAIGRTVAAGRWGRTWSPMIELLGTRPLGDGARAEWDVLPQMQISLSTRQHVVVNAGVRIPVTERAIRSPSLVLYLLWDWFDGGLLDGW